LALGHGDPFAPIKRIANAITDSDAITNSNGDTMIGQSRFLV